MAGDSPPAGLLDRAGKVFSSAGTLGRAFSDARQSTLSVDQSRDEHIRLQFKEFWDALLDVRNEIENPPEGFSLIAEWLKEAAKVAKSIHNAVHRERTFLDALDCFPELNTVAQRGWGAVHETRHGLRLDDPFAFLDEPVPVTEPFLDTTPTSPKPPKNLVEGATRDIPEAMADVQPQGNGTIELIASHLVWRLQKAGHLFASAQWAVHSSIVSGRLVPVRVEISPPAILPPVGGWQQDCDTTIVAGRNSQTGGVSPRVVKVPRPTPFDGFKVIATDRLWEWWHTLTTSQKSESKEDGEGKLSATVGITDGTAQADASPVEPRSQSLENPPESEAAPDAAERSRFEDLPASHRNAYSAYLWAEQMLLETRDPRAKVTDREAYNYIRDQGLPDEFRDYSPPSFETFSTYCQKARRLLGQNKNQRRETLFPNGKSIVRVDEIDN